MSRRYRHSRRRSFNTEMLLAVLLCAGAFKVNEEWLITVLCGAILLIAAGLFVYSSRMWTQSRHHSRLATLAEVDAMGGLEFEAYVADLLRRHGYRNVSLTEPSDFGVDIVAEENGERWGIQTKRYAGRVSDYAVKQVVAGLKSYRCSRSMVITNSTYTSRARKLGKSNGCVLVDRIELARLINDAASTGRRKYLLGRRQGILRRT